MAGMGPFPRRDLINGDPRDSETASGEVVRERLQAGEQERRTPPEAGRCGDVRWIRVARALVALGAVVQGATPHADLINAQVSRSLSHIALYHNIPVINGVVCAHNLEQAIFIVIDISNCHS